MAVKITTVDEAIDDTGLKILVHGLAGAGKTVLCATTKEPTLILSAEGGLLSLKGAPDYIHTAKISSTRDLEEVLIMLRNQREAGEQVYKWIAIDSLSDVAEKVLKDEIDKCNDPRKSYPAYQAEMLKIIKAYRDLPGYNVIMTSKMEFNKDEFTGITLRVPSMPGNKLGPALPYLFDEVFALRVERDENGELYRTLQTNRDVMFEAKDRSGALAMFEQPKLHAIFSAIHGERVEVEMSPVLSSTQEQAEFYWIHSESGSCGIAYSPEQMMSVLEHSDGLAEEVTEERYREFIAENQEVDDDTPDIEYNGEVEE